MRIPQFRLWQTALVATLGISAVATAQEVRGTVTEVVSGAPVSGAVVQLLDSIQTVLGRNIANERGQYRVVVTDGDVARIRRLRIVRIGFRPVEISVTIPASGVLERNVRMTALPTMLEPVRVLDQPKCPQRSDRPAAFALWEQAQTALLATIVAREANPASMLRIGYHRVLDADGKQALRQTVHIDSSAQLAAAFKASRTAADFVRLGFRDANKHADIFLGPDAEVILNDDFLTGYCLHVADRDRDRPTQVGLAFEAADHARDRLDIDGTIWIDTAARALRDIDFRYVGLGWRLEALRPGGHMEFREMPNGVVLLDRWNLRLVGAESTVVMAHGGVRSVDQRPFAEEGGGELARAAWPDGATWQAPLGTLRIHTTNADGSPAVGTVLRLEDSDYRGTADSSGNVEISNILPGLYEVLIADTRLAEIGIAIKSGVIFEAARDSTYLAALAIPTTEDAVRDECVAKRRVPGGLPWLLLRVLSPDGAPVAGVTIAIRMESASHDWPFLHDSGVTGSDGLFSLCGGLKSPVNLVIEARRGAERVDTPLRLTGDLTIAPIRFPSKPQ